MEDEVVCIDSSLASKPGTSRSDRNTEEVVSSTSGYPLVHPANPGKRLRNESPRTLAEFKTKYHADVVEWCPFSAYSDIFLCGTYELQEGDVKAWSGNISLHQLVINPDGSSAPSLQVKGTFELSSGVFDVKWVPWQNQHPRFVIASEDGLIDLYRPDFAREGEEMNIVKEQSTNISLEEKLKPLSLDWNTSGYKKDSLSMVISDSSGHLNELTISTERQSRRRWKAHSFEIWQATYDCHYGNIVYSGSDDCLLKGWDLRTDLTEPIFVCTDHSMGVTSVLKNPTNENLLASGCYDEHILLWDIRKMKYPVSEIHIVDGGIWKLKWHPKFSNYLLVAAMHAGFYIVNMNRGLSMNIEAKYKNHSSLAYGIDWCKRFSWHPDRKDKNIVASCSFYDNLVHVWEVDLQRVS